MLADIGRNAAKGKCTFPVLLLRVSPLGSLIHDALARIHYIMSHKSDVSNREDFRAMWIAKKRCFVPSNPKTAALRMCNASPPDWQERGGQDWSCDTGQEQFNCPSVCRSAELISPHIWRFENQSLLPVFPWQNTQNTQPCGTLCLLGTIDIIDNTVMLNFTPLRPTWVVLSHRTIDKSPLQVLRHLWWTSNNSIRWL